MRWIDAISGKQIDGGSVAGGETIISTKTNVLWLERAGHE
jgi:hypothetical protein